MIHVVSQLLALGHEIALLNRGETSHDLPGDAKHIRGNRHRLQEHLHDIEQFAPDVILDMIPYRQEHARALMDILQGVATRVVGLFSIDVYAAYGRIHETEPGPLQPVPLAESAELRKTKAPHGEDYDKLGVEAEFLGNPALPGTILRLPAIYGPRDGQHRLHKYLKRMDDQRPAILLEEGQAQFRFSRGYVENVAAAITLPLLKSKLLVRYTMSPSRRRFHRRSGSDRSATSLVGLVK